MWRKVLSLVTVAVGTVALSASAQSDAAKIRSALGAAPKSIAVHAAVKDWPDKTGKMAVLKEGTNGWVCYPSRPETKYRKNDSMCLDPQWQEWFASVVEGRNPKITQTGYAYMLSGNAWESNTDPMGSMAPTADNQWHHWGAHVMVVYPNASMLAGVPTKPSTSGPYVMMAGTPHAHVMWPVK